MPRLALPKLAEVDAAEINVAAAMKRLKDDKRNSSASGNNREEPGVGGCEHTHDASCDDIA